MNKKINKDWSWINYQNMNNKQIKKFVFFKFKDVRTLDFKDTNNFELILRQFEKKIVDHSNVKLEIFNNNFNNYKYLYLTCNTNKYEAKTSELIGTINIKDRFVNQYVNYNYQIFTTNDSDNFFIKNTSEKSLIRDNKIQKVLFESDKIEVIETKLSKGFEYFNTCLKNTQKFQDCYQTLLINYGENANLIAETFFYNYYI